jgi:hypothetical protein
MRDRFTGLSKECEGQTMLRHLVEQIEALLDHIDAMGCVCQTDEWRKHFEEKEDVHLPSNGKGCGCESEDPWV